MKNKVGSGRTKSNSRGRYRAARNPSTAGTVAHNQTAREELSLSITSACAAMGMSNSNRTATRISHLTPELSGARYARPLGRVVRPHCGNHGINLMAKKETIHVAVTAPSQTHGRKLRRLKISNTALHTQTKFTMKQVRKINHVSARKVKLSLAS